MAERCNKRKNLEVHHKRRNGGNGIKNAKVLCEECHYNTSSYGTPGESPEPFSEETKKQAKEDAGYRCECTCENCHS